MLREADVNYTGLLNTANSQLIILPPLFYDIAQSVQSFLINHDTESKLEDDIIYLQHNYSLRKCPEIDYDRYAEAFTYFYFLENFYKAASTFVQQPPPLAKHVTDAGAGSGAELLAYLAALEHSLDEESWTVHVTLLDRSQSQLALAEKLLDHVRPALHHLNILLCAQPIDLQDWTPKADSTDAVLFGHVLNENWSNVENFLAKSLLAVRGGGRIYITERCDDPVWDVINKESSKLLLSTSAGVTELELNRANLSDSPRLALKPYLKAAYLVLHCPKQKHLVQVARNYFRAWESQDVELLEDVFEWDAEYHEKPYARPLRGLEEIKSYWREKVLIQRDIHLRIFQVAYAIDEVFIEWETTFNNPNECVYLMGTLIIHVNPNDHRASSLREYFRTLKHQR